MDDDAIWNLFQALYDDIAEEDQFYIKKPFLAHYTSLEALEKNLAKQRDLVLKPVVHERPRGGQVWCIARGGSDKE